MTPNEPHRAEGRSPGNADSKEQRRWFGARVAACTTAKLGGWFWLPCPVCGEYFGGQEWLTDDEMPASVPDPEQRWLSHGICPGCTRAGYGWPSQESWDLWGWPQFATGGSGFSKVVDDVPPGAVECLP